MISTSIIFAGDFVPKGISPVEFSRKGGSIFKELSQLIESADHSIVNLEAPIINSESVPISKSGPCLGMDASALQVIKDTGFSIVTLANNHFYDYGQAGVVETLSVCESLGIKTVGGGESINQARTPIILSESDKRIALINACEHEFSIADTEHGGSNPLDLVNLQEDIVLLRKEVDYIILILHGGIEGYHYPTPRMKRWYHHFIDIGADAVVNHHQHCINGYEIYRGKPIFYGLGNLYFPWHNQSRPVSWRYGYIVRMTFGSSLEFEICPYTQSDDSIVRRNIDEFNHEIDLLNLPLADDYLLQQKFDEYIIANENYLKQMFLPSFLRGKFIDALSIRGLIGKLYYGKMLYGIKNALTCESHYDKIKRLFELPLIR